MNKNIELLSPAGNREKMESAVRYGADAVYFAGNMFGMRAAADNFDTEGIFDAVKYCHEHNVKAYLTVNTMPRESDYPELKRFLSSLKGSDLDALIVADVGVIALAKELLPEIPLHLSTQSSVLSSAACRAYSEMGICRIVLARELSLAEIIEIKRNIPNSLELEAFIHGSMCVSYSGRCLLSEHFTGRDANNGKCTQPCRWNYHLYNITEEKRPDMPLPIIQSDEGTFVMSSKDLCMIEHIPELLNSGITSFKIEGRMKSAYYTAVTANAYRMAFDRYLQNPVAYENDPLLLRELESVSHREYSTGYFFTNPMDRAQICTKDGYLREKAYIAVALGYDAESKTATFIQRNKVSVNDTVELITPGKVGRAFTLTDMTDEKGTPIESAPHPNMIFCVKVPFEVKEGDILRM